MTKARIDRMESGRVLRPEDGCELVSLTWGVYINSSGNVVSTTNQYAHVAEYRILKPSNHFAITHYNPNSSNYTTAYYNSSGRFTSGRRGNSQTLVSQFATDIIWFTAGVATVRVYGIYDPDHYPNTRNKIANMLTQPYAVGEIRVRPEGASVSQIVWPVQSKFVIVSASVQYYAGSNYGGIWALAANGTSSAYAVATVKEMLGQTELNTYTDVVLDAVSILDNGRDNINGQIKDRFRIETFQNPGHSSPIIGHAVVRGNNWLTTESPGGAAGMGTDVIFTYQGLVSTTLLVGQHGNIVINTTYKNEYVLGYNIELSRLEIQNPTGGNRDVSVTGTLNKVHTPEYEWLSNSFSDGEPEPYSENGLDSISVSPSAGVTINDNVVTLPDNTGANEVTYSITGTYLTNNHDTKDVIVYGYDSGYSYSNLSVTASYGNIAAGGGSAYADINISIRRSDGKTMTGSVGAGETSCLVSGGGASTTVNIAYSGNLNGLISASSRGTTTGVAIVVGTTSITISKNWKNGGHIETTVSASCTQNANSVSIVQGNFNLTALSVAPLVDSIVLPISGGVYQLNTALNTEVMLQVRATGQGTTTQYTYSSGIVVGGDTVQLNNEPVTPSALSAISGGSPIILNEGIFTADNRHNLSDKSYSFSATYEGTTVTSSMKQKKDAKLDSDTPVYTVTLTQVSGSNTLAAAGGEVKLEATAYHTVGKIWESDGTPAEAGVTPIYDLNLLSLVEIQNIGYTRSIDTNASTSTKTVYRYQHRDMKNYETTDPLVVYAKVGNYKDTSENPLSYSITNTLINSPLYPEYGSVNYTDPYIDDTTYQINSRIDHYASESDPAPFIGGNIQTTYSVDARHIDSYYRDGIQNVDYYKRYTSWTALTDDLEHKVLDHSETVTVEKQFVTSVSVPGDSYSISTTYSWLHIDDMNKIISIDAQVDSQNGTPPRTGVITIVNISDTSASPASMTRSIYQQAYKKLTVDSRVLAFDWDELQSAILNVTTWYTQFRVSVTGTWLSVLISLDGGVTYSAIDENTTYGLAAGMQYPKIKVAPTTRNDPSFNPNGYQQTRLGQVTLVPQDAIGVSSVYISVSQAPYDGGLPTD